MSDAHASEAHANDHGDDLGDADGHGAETLGPIDTLAWGAGALGVLLGLVVWFCLILATA